MTKVALVTGGAVRIGRALSLGLAEAGFDLAVHYHTSEGPARELVRRVEALGRQAVLVRADLGDPSGVRAIADAVEDAHGRLDLLVNSAATFREGSLLDLDVAEWDRVMAVNLRGPFLLVQALAPLLRDAEGSVINILDLSAFQPWTGRPHHAVSKAGLRHLTRILARVMAPRVRVNGIAPGTVLPPPDFGPDERERERDRTLLGTLGTPEDVVRTALFLVASPFITGEVVVVDGGRGLSRSEG